VKLVVVILADGRKVNVPGREAAMLEALVDHLDELARVRNGAFTLSIRDEKVTPDVKRIGRTYRADQGEAA